MQITDNKVPLVLTNATDITTIRVMDKNQMPSSITHTTINSLSLDVTEEQPSWGHNMNLSEPPSTQLDTVSRLYSLILGSVSPPPPLAWLVTRV